MNTKKVIKTISATLVFVLVFAVMFTRVSEILCRKTVGGAWNYTEKISGFYNSPQNEYDVMFFGSSNTYCSFNPLVIYKESSIKSYVLATQNQPVWASYTYMKEALKTQKPKVIVMDILAFSYTEEYSDEGVTHSYMDDLPLSKNKLELASASAPDYGTQFELLCNFVKYHSRWNELTQTDFTFKRSEARDYLKGYVLLEGTFPEAKKPVTGTTEKTAIQAKQKEYFYKIVNLAQENNITLLLVKTPSNATEENQKSFNSIKEMAEKEGVPLIDFNSLYDEINLDMQSDFFDKSHLNYKGAEKFSVYFSKILKKEYPDISPKDSNGTNPAWQKDLAEYKKYCKKIENP